MKVSKIIYNILKADTAVTAQVADRIFPLIAPQKVATPFIIHGQTANRPTDSKDGPSTADISTAEVYVFHENMSTTEDVAELVRVALDRFTGITDGIEVVTIQYLGEDPNYDIDTGWFFKKLEFKIIAKR